MNKINNVITLINDIARQLHVVYNDPVLCDQYAWWTLEYITGKTKAWLITQQEPLLTQEQTQELSRWLNALIIKKEPIQYLIGSVPFNDVEILVAPPTLIPRPETEEWCINLIKQLQKIPTKALSILDMCCGSGCIAISLAQALPHATVYAVDKAQTALDLTQRNMRHNTLCNVTTLHSDLFTSIPPALQFDLIVCNPPYIAPEEWQTLDDSVTIWEDKNALIAQDHGLELIKKIIIQAPSFIQSNALLEKNNIPQLMLEIGYAQATAVTECMRQAQYTDIVVHKDLEGKDRLVCGRINNVATANT